jgi:putative tricarboxylic transport membrane protein
MRLKPTFGAVIRVLALMGAISAPVLISGQATAQSYPSKTLNWTIAFGPGGGNDIMSRTIISILEKYELYPGEIVAQNQPGGSGAVGWGFVHNKKGDPYHITSTSGSYITTPLQADTPWSPTSFTPIALLATDDLILLVNAKSPIKTFDEFIEHAKAKRMAIGGIGAVNVDFIVPTLLAEKAGFEFDYVSFNKQGEMMTALLSEALDAMMSNPGEVTGLLESGDLRAIGYSGKKVPEAIKDVPTFGEKGYELGISMPRGIVMPPDVPAEARDWWIETMKQVVEKPEWAEYVKKNNLTETVMFGEDFRKFLGDTQDQFAKILKAKGAIK